MPKKTNPEGKKTTPRSSPSLSLHVEPVDTKSRNVDAEEFFQLAERWLKSLKTFACDTGQQHVKWEIVELRKASAFVQVRPIEAKTRKPLPSLVREWDKGLRQVQKTGRAPDGFTQSSLQALQEFVRAVPPDSMVSLGIGAKKKPVFVTAETQRRVEQAVAAAPSAVPAEYSVRGKLRGRLAVLNSWNPAERTFRLQVPLAPGKPVNCTYRDEQLVNELGSGFEGMVEVDGLLHYRREEVWPHRAEVSAIRVLSREQVTSLEELVGIFKLPDGQDSVTYVRSLRDAE